MNDQLKITTDLVREECAKICERLADGGTNRKADYACAEAIRTTIIDHEVVERTARDAQRYRWLRERYSGADMEYKDFGDNQRGRPVAIFSVKNPWLFSFDFEEAAKLLDEAIDAAIAAEEKK